MVVSDDFQDGVVGLCCGMVLLGMMMSDDVWDDVYDREYEYFKYTTRHTFQISCILFSTRPFDTTHT